MKDFLKFKAKEETNEAMKRQTQAVEREISNDKEIIQDNFIEGQLEDDDISMDTTSSSSFQPIAPLSPLEVNRKEDSKPPTCPSIQKSIKTFFEQEENSIDQVLRSILLFRKSLGHTTSRKNEKGTWQLVSGEKYSLELN